MTKPQIEAHLNGAKKKYQDRLDLVNMLTRACVDVRHHIAPSKKIVTKFKELFGDAASVYWSPGNQDKFDFRQLSAWGTSVGVSYEDRIYISAMPNNWSWDYVFEQLRNLDKGLQSNIRDIDRDLNNLDVVIDWHTQFRSFIENALKSKPEECWNLSRCFGRIELNDDPKNEPPK